MDIRALHQIEIIKKRLRTVTNHRWLADSLGNIYKPPIDAKDRQETIILATKNEAYNIPTQEVASYIEAVSPANIAFIIEEVEKMVTLCQTLMDYKEATDKLMKALIAYDNQNPA